MLITMFTDISLCSITGLGAYAVWAKADGRTLRNAAIFKQPIDDSNLAEARAIINGLAIVVQRIQPPGGSRIIAQTDSVTAISILDGTHSAERYAGLADYANTIQRQHEIAVEYRHVEGHRGNRTRRNAVNTWCDRECARVLHEARTCQAFSRSIANPANA